MDRLRDMLRHYQAREKKCWAPHVENQRDACNIEELQLLLAEVSRVAGDVKKRLRPE